MTEEDILKKNHSLFQKIPYKTDDGIDKHPVCIKKDNSEGINTQIS